MLIPGCEVKFQQDLEIAWVLFTLLFYVLPCCLNIVRSSMEKYKLKGLLFFSHFISSYSCFHLNIKNGKGTEDHSYDSCFSDLSGTTHFLLLSLIFFSLGNPGALTGYSSCLSGPTAFWSSCWAAPEVNKKVRHCVLGAGDSRTSQECGTGGKTDILGIHEGWKLPCVVVHMYLCGPGCCVCIYISVGLLSDPSWLQCVCQDVCVCTIVRSCK